MSLLLLTLSIVSNFQRGVVEAPKDVLIRRLDSDFDTCQAKR